jgi:hypothetical protein
MNRDLKRDLPALVIVVGVTVYSFLFHPNSNPFLKHSLLSMGGFAFGVVIERQRKIQGWFDV